MNRRQFLTGFAQGSVAGLYILASGVTTPSSALPDEKHKSFDPKREYKGVFVYSTKVEATFAELRDTLLEIKKVLYDDMVHCIPPAYRYRAQFRFLIRPDRIIGEWFWKPSDGEFVVGYVYGEYERIVMV